MLPGRSAFCGIHGPDGLTCRPMRTYITLLLTCLLLAIATPVTASDPSPVSNLLGLFAHHGTPAPRCKDPKACTATEQAARDDVAAVRLEAARSITAVAYDPTEPPLFRSRTGRARTAVLLGVIATHETGLRPRLVRGECKPGECDGGKAVGAYQIHPGEYGIKLVGDGILVCAEAQKNDEDCHTRTELLADQTLSARVALHMLRGGLSHYTGEGDQEGETSATIREWSAGWIAEHPLASDADVLAAMTEHAYAGAN